ncbi:tetratricopeptide repeat protein [Winogradskyella psychrotolerans]|uniref:tetratricopeptide repeat protein n=1 Tax=Winogradskyella psychrotolerans TaxID=1344585 RepID=UPI001C079A4C|nr:tetratricopeptide repeat protein [Winogradskyella psychrotolerans]MBU2921760.1 tetratricopeptide repeat protein [Winogradskyella psychrotolerans]
MKTVYIYITVLFLTLTACVDNPNVTEEDFLDNTNSATSWIVGIKRQLALTMNEIVINSEMVSDNYFNNYTLYNKVYDIPQIDYTDIDGNSMQVEIGALREMAEYALETVLPSDPDATAQQWSYAYFAKAYALILSGENFTGLPMNSNGEAYLPSELLDESLSYLDLAIENESDAETISAYQLLKSRVYRSLGDRANAKSFAQTVISNTGLLFTVEFDGTNGVSNEIQNATFTASENRFAPLPRLDFLDPKFFDIGTAAEDQKPMALAKVEESYLILAEAYTAENNIEMATATLHDLIDNVLSARPVMYLDDSEELRNGTNRQDYPTTAVDVRFESGQEFRSGYVLDRQADLIPVYTVSGTSVSHLDIDAAENVDDVLYLIYLMRQEIFISEGRRSNDLGIKFPVSQTEQLNNPNISDEFTLPVIPSFIPMDLGLDDFTVDETTGNVTMLYDMNRVLVANKTSTHVLPFN